MQGTWLWLLPNGRSAGRAGCSLCTERRPMMRMCYGRRLNAVGRFYVPLDMLNIQVPAAAHFFDWYIHRVWGVPPGENWFIY